MKASTTMKEMAIYDGQVYGPILAGSSFFFFFLLFL